MVIDFHTHAFPDALAGRAIAGLCRGADGTLEPCHDGTVGGLKLCMQKFGIDISVLQPVITKQSQTETLNKWAASVQDDKIVTFGGVFPHTDDYKRDIDYVCSLGLRGLKFHPEYQNFTVDAPKMLEIYDYALNKGLVLLFHAGYDIAFKPPFHSSPRQFRHIVDELKGGKIIAAHMGGIFDWDDTAECLAGTEIYLDTSMGFEYYGEARFLRLLAMHGSKHILFGSDSPWSNGGKEIRRLRALPISDAEKEDILSGNAARLLGL